jgi:hypothetical protein
LKAAPKTARQIRAVGVRRVGGAEVTDKPAVTHAQTFQAGAHHTPGARLAGRGIDERRLPIGAGGRIGWRATLQFSLRGSPRRSKLGDPQIVDI